MRKKLILLISIGLVILGAGTAVGIALEGLIAGKISLSVDKPFILDTPAVSDEGGNTWPHNQIASVNEERTKFSASVEAGPGDTFIINLPITNRSTSNLYVELVPSLPTGVTLTVDGSGLIPSTNIVFSRSRTWMFTLVAGAAG